MIYAQYDILTGQITGTNSQKVDDAALVSLGKAQVAVEDGIDGGAYSIDLATLQPVPL